MLRDFERLYVWRKRRFFLAPKDVLVVLPKEIDISSLKQFWLDVGHVKFENDFVRYLEWFDGRLALPEEELQVIDFEDLRDVEEATKEWLKKKIDTKQIGAKEFYSIEEEIEKNKEKL